MDIPAGAIIPFTFTMEDTVTSDDIRVTISTDASSVAPRETTSLNYTATAHPKTIAGGASYSYDIVVTNLPLKYREGNLIIQFDVSYPKAIETDTHPFDITFAGSWSLSDGQSLPADIIQFDSGNSNLTKQAEGVTVVKRAIIRAITTTSVCSRSNPSFVPNGAVRITITNNAGDPIKINDVQNTLTYMYNKEEYS